jgi:hypothetical protein
VTFAFIATHRGIWPAGWLCEALGVSRGGFYAWRIRSPSARAKADEELLPRGRGSFLASDRTYGARRVWHDLLADGISCGRHRIERLMRHQALRARQTTAAAAGHWCAVNERRGAKRPQPDVQRLVGEPQMGRGLHVRLDRRRLALRRRRP